MLFRFFCALFFVLSANAFAVTGQELHSGDILLQPLNCYLCNAIEQEENSIYSHSGVVLINNQKEAWVLESIGGKGIVTLREFLARTQKKQMVRVVRPREFAEQPVSFERLFAEFQKNFFPVAFDSEMLWDNVNAEGSEPLYCSEFVAKFLAKFMRVPYSTKPMHYALNRPFWIEYFKGNVPDGKPGIAPSDFLNSQLSMDLGELETPNLG